MGIIFSGGKGGCWGRSIEPARAHTPCKVRSFGAKGEIKLHLRPSVHLAVRTKAQTGAAPSLGAALYLVRLVSPEIKDRIKDNVSDAAT